MSRTSCSEESAVARAVRSGEWSESLGAHVRECAVCREVQETARWMQGLAQDGEIPGDLPDPPPQHAQVRRALGTADPQVLWLRGQLSRKQLAAERAHKVMQWVEIVCVAAVCAGLGIWLAWSGNGIGGEVADRLGWALFDSWPALWANVSAYGPTNAPILFSSALAAIAIVALGVAYPLLVRE